MPSGLKLLVPPTAEPVSLADAKAQVRQDLTVDDVKITKLVRAARRLLEEQFGMSFVAQTWEMTLDRFPRYSSSAVWQYNSDAIWQQRLPVTQLSGQWYPDRASIRVPRPPFLSVQSLTYFDGNGSPQTIQTIIPAAIGSGVQSVTPYDMTGVYAGTQYLVMNGSTTEVITVSAVTATTFTATFANSYGVNSMLSALPQGVAPFTDGVADTDATTVIARIAPAYGATTA